ncbi:MAG TPA: hypothetical protein VN677_02550 [Gemmatimonadaceae bacterium]|jgi:putative lipoprotein|nr:hypothetical protein [Gemmatimonadaceae bacterium]
MHALILVFALHGGLRSEPGQRGDAWFGPDKFKHFFVSAMVETVSYGALRLINIPHYKALQVATVATVVVGAGKEIEDWQNGERFSVPDLTWDLAGAASAAAILQAAR